LGGAAIQGSLIKSMAHKGGVEKRRGICLDGKPRIDVENR
jgi:hypothetical protein